MKDWEKRLADLDERLVEWRAAYDREFERLRKERGRGFFKRLSKRLPPEETEAIAIEAQRAAGEDILAEVSAFFDELCAFYHEALPMVRAKIRARCGEHDELFAFLWQYAAQAPDSIRTADDAERYRLALTAVAIDDHRVETGRMYDVLGRLYVAASKAGIDADGILLQVAQVANASTSGGAGHTQFFLMNFTGSRYFRENVAPQLPSAGRRSAG